MIISQEVEQLTLSGVKQGKLGNESRYRLDEKDAS
ncbi:hypothetical protein N39L_50880 [Limnospira platensis NIES-39]|uniref:Transposase n=1 Tax=Limnospira platensis NIES-46 TaxID=1236695 RepID=A0A5M3TEG5_LIMPL|nr:hypothetical protein N39L_50880 [Arthrospira platensis NIES-39]GCE96398.1 hypothetical protein NIES46_44700 [Arthrospira platensis NIES-46]